MGSSESLRSSNIAAFINNMYFSGTSCSKDQCWCVSNGGTTCQKWDNTYAWFALHWLCVQDECYPRESCPKNGYWCDDNQNPGVENQGLC